MAIALEDDLGIDECPIVEIDIGERAAVFIHLVLVELEANLFPLGQALGEFVSLLAKCLDGLAGILGFGCVDADKPDGLVAIKDERIAVHDADAGSPS